MASAGKKGAALFSMFSNIYAFNLYNRGHVGVNDLALSMYVLYIILSSNKSIFLCFYSAVDVVE